MKKRNAPACIIAAGFLLLSLSGCKKLLDYIHPKPDDKGKNCRIERATWNATVPSYPDLGPFFDTAWFAYNAHGNPVSVKYYHGDEIFTNNKVFKYDHHKRLTVYLEGAPNTSIALFWHKYTYIGDYVIIDSTFVYGEGDWSANDRPAHFDRLEVTTYDLDAYGRVKKEVGGPFNVTLYYSYDANGNLVKPGVSYSNKTNIRQISKVWMFLDRDYSINSPNGAASQYNQHKLPVKLIEMPHFIHEFGGDYHDIVVNYKCK